MRIDHVAIWVRDLERMRAFYEQYFAATASENYVNPAKGFSSYFLSFGGGDSTRLELMHREDITSAGDVGAEHWGYAHLAMSLGSQVAVDQMAQRLRDDGYELLDGPRTTGDGYYEALLLDPEGNRLEITI